IGVADQRRASAARARPSWPHLASTRVRREVNKSTKNDATGPRSLQIVLGRSVEPSQLLDAFIVLVIGRSSADGDVRPRGCARSVLREPPGGRGRWAGVHKGFEDTAPAPPGNRRNEAKAVVRYDRRNFIMENGLSGSTRREDRAQNEPRSRWGWGLNDRSLS